MPREQIMASLSSLKSIPIAIQALWDGIVKGGISSFLLLQMTINYIS
jgi:hypothetical protein